MHEQLAETIFTAIREHDAERLRPLLTSASTWELPGRSALAGTHRGPDAILPVLRRVAELRPIRPDAYDIMASDYHAVLTTRLVADGLDSDHAVVVVADEDGRLDRAFHYLFDLYAFDRFFTR
jgi:ketosteroid isomerase-like protein